MKFPWHSDKKTEEMLHWLIIFMIELVQCQVPQYKFYIPKSLIYLRLADNLPPVLIVVNGLE